MGGISQALGLIVVVLGIKIIVPEVFAQIVTVVSTAILVLQNALESATHLM